MPSPFPSTYRNSAVEHALATLLAEPTMDAFAALLAAAGQGGLVVDVTGSPAGETRVRTIRSTAGELVLPLFSSMTALREAVGAAEAEHGGKGSRVQAVVIPSREALALIRTDDFVAVQFNPGPRGMVVAREHIEEMLGESSCDGTDPVGGLNRTRRREHAPMKRPPDDK